MKRFLLIAICIAIFGLVLRFIDYEKVPPFDVTKDEFFYPWSGMTFLTTGNPTAWSLFESYKDSEIVYKWGTWYRIVSPWVEKPPLYSLLAGIVVLASGTTEMFEVRLEVIRLLPIFLSFFTIILIGLVAKKLFSERVAYFSMIFYSTVPTIVMANRLSLVENLLTPIVLLAIYFFLQEFKLQFFQKSKIYIVGVLVGLSLLTKNIAIALPLSFLWILFSERKYKDFIIILVFAFIFSAVHPLIGFIFNWELFVNVMGDYQKVHALVGPPEVIQTIFRFPIVGHQWDRIFPDGGMLAGYILLFASPFIIKKDNKIKMLFLGFPFIYLLALSLLESGSTPYSFFGWHVYPLFPFMMIMIALAADEFLQNLDLLKLLFFFVLLGLSSIRFLVVLFPSLTSAWQAISTITVSVLILGLLYRKNIDRLIIYGTIIIFVLINIVVVFSLNKIYPGYPQPLN